MKKLFDGFLISILLIGSIACCKKNEIQDTIYPIKREQKSIDIQMITSIDRNSFDFSFFTNHPHYKILNQQTGLSKDYTSTFGKFDYNNISQVHFNNANGIRGLIIPFLSLMELKEIYLLFSHQIIKITLLLFEKLME